MGRFDFVSLGLGCAGGTVSLVAIEGGAEGFGCAVAAGATEGSATPTGTPISSRVVNRFQSDLGCAILVSKTPARAANATMIAAIASGRAASGPSGFATRRRCHVIGIPSFRAMASRRSIEARQRCSRSVIITGSSGRLSGSVAAISVMSRRTFVGTPRNLLIAGAIWASPSGSPGALNGETPVRSDQSVQPNE